MKIDAKFRENNEDLTTSFQEENAVFPVVMQENEQTLSATYQENYKPFEASFAEDEMRIEAKFSETQVVGSGSGKDGEDGGYYIPSVDNLGNLKWKPSKASMPQVSSANIKGKDGYTPVKGIDYFDGLPGTDGKDGYTPIKGVDYFDGLPGVDGKPGDPGKDGIDGYTPIKGVDYFDGLPGKDGEDGQDGLPGRDGKDGYTPVKGVDYFDGLPGKDGVDGQPGKDGYTPIKGVDYFDGQPGEPGKDGYTPIKGVDYFDGQPGPAGADGQPGKDGYSPVRGKDYWTDADKTAMIAELNKNFADYVIEAGTTNGWKWEKWNSGKYICWRLFRYTRTHYTTVNGFYGYYSSDFRYPITFPEAPIVHFNCKVGSGFAAPAGDVAMSTVQARCYALSTASGEVACSWELYVVGRWK